MLRCAREDWTEKRKKLLAEGDEAVLEEYRSNRRFTVPSLPIRDLDLDLNPRPPLGSPLAPAEARGDARCAELLHGALRGLPRRYAAYEGLWVWLAHSEFPDYCRQRWPLPASRGRWPNHVLSHWFVTGGKRGLRRHALARLWWAAELTCEPWNQDSALRRYQRQQPYHWTRVLLSNQDIYQGVIERDYGSSLRARIVLLAVLEQLQKDHEGNWTEFVTGFLKLVNRVAAYTDFESLPPEALEEQLGRLARHLSEEGRRRELQAEAAT